MTDHRQRRSVAPPARTDSERFAEVYEAWWPHTVRFVSRRVWPCDQHLVEDLAQTTFLRAWRARDAARADDAELFRWLSAIARNVINDHYRRARRCDEVPVGPDAALWTSTRCADPAPITSSCTPRPELVAALRALPAQTRTAVELNVANAMTAEATAQCLDRGRTTVRRLVADGLAVLREQLATEPAPAAESGDAA